MLLEHLVKRDEIIVAWTERKVLVALVSLKHALDGCAADGPFFYLFILPTQTSLPQNRSHTNAGAKRNDLAATCRTETTGS